MPIERNRSKSENLSLRFDAKTRFILEFVARVRGQTITMVVERAIKDSSGGVKIGTDDHLETARTWFDFWDSCDGVRILRLLADMDYPTTFDEDELRSFTLTHWPFFYVSAKGDIPRRPYVEILWPKISEYLEMWREWKGRDYWSVGAKMATELEAARVVPPEWPPKASNAPVAKPARATMPSLDDEIPF
jgi:hypothetical protein